MLFLKKDEFFNGSSFFDGFWRCICHGTSCLCNNPGEMVTIPAAFCDNPAGMVMNPAVFSHNPAGSANYPADSWNNPAVLLLLPISLQHLSRPTVDHRLGIFSFARIGYIHVYLTKNHMYPLLTKGGVLTF